MEVLCTLNRSIYACVEQNIGTDEVVITDERIEHIKVHHPNDYEMFGSFIPEMIEAPDYILHSELYATALVLKSFMLTQSVHLRLIVRLQTATDDPMYKNSVITFQKVHQREYKRLVSKAEREGKLLYKRPGL